MPDHTSGNAGGRSADEPGHDAARESPVPERLDEAECLRLISSGGVGRARVLRSVRSDRASGPLQAARGNHRVPYRARQLDGRGPAHGNCRRRVQGGLRDRRHQPNRARRVERPDPRPGAPCGIGNRAHIGSEGGRRTMGRRGQGTLPPYHPYSDHRPTHSAALRWPRCQQPIVHGNRWPPPRPAAAAGGLRPAGNAAAIASDWVLTAHRYQLPRPR